jgi:acyl carrier protein
MEQNAATVDVSEIAPLKPKDRAEVDSAIRRMIVAALMLDVKPEDIPADKEDFVIALGANSIDALELIMSVEERFKFEFDDSQLNPDLMLTLDHFVSQVCTRIGVTH